MLELKPYIIVNVQSLVFNLFFLFFPVTHEQIYTFSKVKKVSETNKNFYRYLILKFSSSSSSS